MFSRVAVCAFSFALALPVVAQDAPVLRTVPADEVAALMEGRETGRAWLAVEVELEEAFRSGRASEGNVTSMVMRSGELRAELRAVHLAAHIHMRPHLTIEQLDIYGRLPARAATGG